jgi:SAM-dependent MidA family methyltransferase
MYKTIQGVQLVEASPGLRKVQRAKLIPGSQESDVKLVEDSQSVPVQQCIRSDGISVNWYDGVEDLPDAWSMIMAHEFFDALAIHTFEVRYALVKSAYCRMKDIIGIKGANVIAILPENRRRMA